MAKGKNHGGVKGGGLFKSSESSSDREKVMTVIGSLSRSEQWCIRTTTMGDRATERTRSRSPSRRKSERSPERRSKHRSHRHKSEDEDEDRHRKHRRDKRDETEEERKERKKAKKDRKREDRGDRGKLDIVDDDDDASMWVEKGVDTVSTTASGLGMQLRCRMQYRTHPLLLECRSSHTFPNLQLHPSPEPQLPGANPAKEIHGCSNRQYQLLQLFLIHLRSAIHPKAPGYLLDALYPSSRRTT